MGMTNEEVDQDMIKKKLVAMLTVVGSDGRAHIHERDKVI
jgi:hypothetical protein